MRTGDNVLIARSIPPQCGIFTAGGIIMEGPIFRQLNDKEMLDIVSRLQVLARSSPEDKKILVEKLRALGEIGCVTGDGTNDGPSLKTEHVGFSKAIMWGRCVNDAVRKFLQFQLSTNMTAALCYSCRIVIGDLCAFRCPITLDQHYHGLLRCSRPRYPSGPPALLDRNPDRFSTSLFTVDMYKSTTSVVITEKIVFSKCCQLVEYCPVLLL